MDEKKIEEELNVYRQLGAQDKKIDVASLMINALQHHEDNSLTAKEKRWAYLFSISTPPVGLFFAAKYYYSNKDDGKRVALICVILTVVSILLLWLISVAALSGTGDALNKASQLTPQDIRNTLQ